MKIIVQFQGYLKGELTENTMAEGKEEEKEKEASATDKAQSKKKYQTKREQN